MKHQEQFCPNNSCPVRGIVGQNNIVVYSHKEARYRCKICNKIFAATTGMPLHQLHHPADLMFIVVLLIAHGCPLHGYCGDLSPERAHDAGLAGTSRIPLSAGV